MSEIRYRHQYSSTFSTVFAVWIIAQAVHGVPAHNVAAEHPKPLLQNAYSLDSNKSTYGRYSTSITGEYNIVPNGFEQSVGDFYARLLHSQEPLGNEFEKVLYENIWDLYES